MRHLPKLGLLLAVLVFLASFMVESHYASRARLIQRVQVDPTAAELFGDEGTPIGSPQMMIIDDPAAFLDGKTEDGALKVSESYLEEKGIYPLQLQTVRLFTSTGRSASLLAGALCAAMWIFVVVRMRGRPAQDQPLS